MAQLAAIDQTALQSGSLPGARAVIAGWALPGGPTTSSWSGCPGDERAARCATGLSGGGSAQLALVLTPLMGQIKGTVGPTSSSRASTSSLDVTLPQTARGATRRLPADGLAARPLDDRPRPRTGPATVGVAGHRPAIKRRLPGPATWSPNALAALHPAALPRCRPGDGVRPQSAALARRRRLGRRRRRLEGGDDRPVVGCAVAAQARLPDHRRVHHPRPVRGRADGRGAADHAVDWRERSRC